MADPLLSEDFASPFPVADRVSETSFSVKGVGGCPDPDDRLPFVHERREVGGFFRNGLAKPGPDNHQVRVIQFAEPDQALGMVGVNELALFVPGKHNDAIEAVCLTENFTQHWHRLFGTVFFVTGNQDNFLSFAGAFTAFELEDFAGVMIRMGGTREEKRKGKDRKESTFHNLITKWGFFCLKAIRETRIL